VSGEKTENMRGRVVAGAIYQDRESAKEKKREVKARRPELSVRIFKRFVKADCLGFNVFVLVVRAPQGTANSINRGGVR